MNIEQTAEIGANLVPMLAGLAAAYWFLLSRSYRQRVELDCDLRVFDVGEDRPFLAEAILIVENKGQREHRLHNLWCEVRQPQRLAGEAAPACYLPLRNLVSRPMVWFFVAAGVRQTFRITFEIPRGVKIAKMVALFVHQQRRVDLPEGVPVSLEALNRRGLTPHSVAKLFAIAPVQSDTVPREA